MWVWYDVNMRCWLTSLEFCFFFKWEQPQFATKEMTSRLSDVSCFVVFFLPHLHFETQADILPWQSEPDWQPCAKHLEVMPFSVLVTVSKSDDIWAITRSSPWVFNQQGLDEVDGQRGDPLKRVLRVVYVDLRDVEECLLLVITQEGRLARQHDIGQDPNTPVGEWGRRGREVMRQSILMVTSESILRCTSTSVVLC